MGFMVGARTPLTGAQVKRPDANANSKTRLDSHKDVKQPINRTFATSQNTMLLFGESLKGF